MLLVQPTYIKYWYCSIKYQTQDRKRLMFKSDHSVQQWVRGKVKWDRALFGNKGAVFCHAELRQPSLEQYFKSFVWKGEMFHYLTQSSQPRRCSSGPRRRTGRASRSGCRQPPLSSFSICTQSPPWGIHLNKRQTSGYDTELELNSKDKKRSSVQKTD